MGSYSVRLELIDLASDAVIARAEAPGEIKVNDPLLAHEMVFCLRGLSFPNPGEYEFRVFAYDRVFGQKTFRVVDRRTNVQEL